MVEFVVNFREPRIAMFESVKETPLPNHHFTWDPIPQIVLDGSEIGRAPPGMFLKPCK